MKQTIEPLVDEVITFDTPLVFSASIDTANIKNLLLIDSLVSESQLFYDSANSSTFPVIYSYESNVNDFNSLLTKFRNIDRISFVFHDNILSGKSFINGELLFTPDDIIDNATSFSPNTQLLIDTIKKLNVKHIDFLACNSLNYSNWVKFYNLLNKRTNVVVGASNDKTGNLKYGGDWVMENTNENVVNTYFTSNIQKYTASLSSTISQSGGIIYIQQSGTDIQFQSNSTNDDSWTTFWSWPVTFVNDTPAAETILTISLFTNITINSGYQYFITGSNFITYDGTGKTVTIDGFSNYGGLIQNGRSDLISGYSNVKVQNINSSAVLEIYGISSDSGFICQKHFGKAANNIVINNCSNSGTISNNGSGGICGSNIGDSYGNVSITNCSNSGLNSGTRVGGICGRNAGNNYGNVSITNCSNSGLNTGDRSAGICGQNAGTFSGKVSITNCSNTGDVSCFIGGGICSAFAGYISGNVSITNCSNSGLISGEQAGGICGILAGFDNATISITNCSNSGLISGESASGICGQQAGFHHGNVSITNCSNTGVISGESASGICGQEAGYSSGNVSITNCSNTGVISGESASGICGQKAGYFNGKVSIKNCYNTGVINGTNQGGIIGSFFGINTDELCSIINCYNLGNITGNNSGGITGSQIGFVDVINTAYKSNILIENCYSLGDIATTCGGILGGNEVDASGNPLIYNNNNIPTVNIINCYTSYNTIVDADSEYIANSLQIKASIIKTNVYTQFINSWSDSLAQSALTGAPTSLYISNPAANWTTIQTNTPYILSAFNANIYSPNTISNDSGKDSYTSLSGVFSNSNYNLLSVNDSLPTNVSIDNTNGKLTFVKNQPYTKYLEKVFVSNGTAPYYYGYNVNSFTLNQSLTCFKEGSKILAFNSETNVEEYIEIEKLRKGDLVKTILHGYKPISHIGYSKMYNQVNEVRSKGKLYKCSNREFPEVFEDLVITGCHSILVKEFKETEREETKEILGEIYVTDAHYRLPACVDKRTKIYEEDGVHTVWHFSLENDNYYMNYGVYANGLLVETTSNRMMKELSGAQLIE
jgi:hypothetical protein